MITADEKKWARLFFNPYEERLLKKNFDNFLVTGNLPLPDESSGLLITPNHISWWDGFFIDYFARKFISKKFHIIMLEEQLRKYKFFRMLGAFSIDPSNPASVRKSLDYAADIISDPGNMLVFYPQGSIESFDKRPVIKEGIRYLLKKSEDTQVITAAFRIEYSNKKRPSVYARFGDVLNAGEICRSLEIYENAFSENISRLASAIHFKEAVSDIFLKGK